MSAPKPVGYELLQDIPGEGAFSMGNEDYTPSGYAILESLARKLPGSRIVTTYRDSNGKV